MLTRQALKISIRKVQLVMFSSPTKSSTNNKEDIVDSKYDLKRMSFQSKLGIDLNDARFQVGDEVMKGADLRRNRKKLHEDHHPKKSSDTKKSISKRFKLGNGIEGLSPEALVGAVYSTAP